MRSHVARTMIALGVAALVFATLTGCISTPTGVTECFNNNLAECGNPAIAQRVTVNVTSEGGGHGSVTTSQAVVGINCSITSNPSTGAVMQSGVCSNTFADVGGGGGFSLRASALAGYWFGGWSGDCSGDDPVCSLSFAPGGDVTFNVIARFYPVDAES